MAAAVVVDEDAAAARDLGSGQLCALKVKVKSCLPLEPPRVPEVMPSDVVCFLERRRLRLGACSRPSRVCELMLASSGSRSVTPLRSLSLNEPVSR